MRGAVILGENIFTGSDDILKILTGYFLLTIILALGVSVLLVFIFLNWMMRRKNTENDV